MKKAALLLIAAALCATTAQAADFLAFGVKAGLEMPKINTKDLRGSAEARTGFHVGAFVQLNIPIIRVQPEVLYARRGVGGNEIDYIDIPVNITWSPLPLGKDLVRPFLAVTPYASYGLSDVSTDIRDSADNLKKLDLKKPSYGVGFGAGVELFNTIQVAGRYNLGLTGLADDGSYKVRGFTVSLGYIF